MFKEEYDGLIGCDEIGSQEITGVGEGMTKEWSDEEDWI